MTTAPAQQGDGPIRVVHVITGLNVGGAEMMLQKLVSRSDPTRFRHTVISLMEVGPVGDQIANLGVPVHSLQMRAGVPDPRAIVRLRSLLRQMNPDVIQTWLYHADFVGLLGGVLTGIPVVWNIRNAHGRDLGRVVTMIASMCALLSRIPAAIVTNSNTAQARHSRLGYRPKEWLVIPNGFDVERFAPDAAAREDVRRELGMPDEAVVIGMVGRYHPMKDHESFVRAAGILNRHWPEAHFALVGRGLTIENGPLRQAIEHERLSDRVHLLGERADIPRLTAAFDIAANTSFFGESFSNAIGEAMACAVPCAVTDVGDMANVVGETGRVVAPRNAPALAAAWRELIELGPVARAELGLRGRARIEALYSLDSVVRQYEMLYEGIATSR